MNPNPSTATTGGNVAAPLFRLEHCSAESSSSGYFFDGLDVRQIREALTGHCLHECTNIPTVELTGQGSIAVSFKLVGRSRHEQRAGYRARGLCVGELHLTWAVMPSALHRCAQKMFDVVDLEFFAVPRGFPHAHSTQNPNT